MLLTLVSWSIATLAMGTTDATEIVLAKRVFHAGDFGFGLLASLCGVGLVHGSSAASRLVTRTSLAVYGGGLGLMGVD